MRFGIVDCIENDYDVFPAVEATASKLSEISIQRITAPDILKTPICAKKLFAENVDSVIIFLTLSEEDKDSMNLVVEKMMGVELEFSKYVFYVTVSTDSFKNKDDFIDEMSKKFELVFNLIMDALKNPSSVSEKIGSEQSSDFQSFSAFAMFNEENERSKPGENQSEVIDSHSLFG